MSPKTQRKSIPIIHEQPEHLAQRVPLVLMGYSESSFTDPHTVVSLEEPAFDPDAYSHIGKIYEGVEPYRMGGHRVDHNKENTKECVHHFDPNHREFCILQLEHRTELQTLCLSTRFFAGNPASDLRVTLVDDVHKEECIIPVPHLKPDCAHWIDGIDFSATRIILHFKAGGLTRVWTYGSKTEVQLPELTWLSKNRKVLFREDDFFGGPDFALSEQANRSNQHMLGWETSRSAMGLQAVFPITKGVVQKIIIDTYRHVNNYLRSAWVFGAYLPEGTHPHKEDSPLWHITSSEGEEYSTHDVKSFFAELHSDKTTWPTYGIAPKSNDIWTLQTTFELSKDAMHVQSQLQFNATHICIMFLPHGGLHAMRVLGTPE